MAPMNHLAHAFLAGADDEVLLGGLLGDFWRGAPDPHWPPAIRTGVVLHRKIDVYTDSHADVARARTLFAPPLRRYAGILLDVYFDHVLAVEWPRHGREPLAALSARAGRLLQANRHWLPPPMNHLAQAFLAGADGEVVLGGLLGDFWRGAPDPHWPARIRAGVVLHRRIDVYTDNHREVAAARALFAPPLRRYAGILLDVYFDHVLATDWPRHAREPLAALSARVEELLRANEDWLPARLNRFAGYFRQAELFEAYADREVIERVLAGLSQRLKHDNPLASAGPALWEREAELGAVFARFFPDLVVYATGKREELLT